MIGNGRSVLLALAGSVVLLSASGARAGGSFERIVGVGAGGVSAAIELDQTGSRSDAALGGTPVPLPNGGYVRLYPFIGGLPAIPGRFYPEAHVLCLYWHEPASNCTRLAVGGRTLLAPLAHLPLRHEAPTTPTAVRYRSRLVRSADGNIFAALELAIERPSLVRSPVPPNAIPLAVTWRGPNAAQLPAAVFLTPSGVYARGHLFPLQHGPWCYLAGNLRDASAFLIEATARICR
jgi:hypothetical protein